MHWNQVAGFSFFAIGLIGMMYLCYSHGRVNGYLAGYKNGISRGVEIFGEELQKAVKGIKC